MDEDTEPYICLSEECTSPMLFFVHMKDWMSHMKTFHSDQWNRRIHMSTWYCDIGHEKEIQFNDRESFLRHMKDPTNHDGREPPTDLQLDTLSRNKHKILVRDDEYCCPICECVPDALEVIIRIGGPDEIRNQLFEHIAAHIKDIAFKSVPALDEDEPSEGRQSQFDEEEDRRRLRGDGEAASYPSGLDGLRQEMSLALLEEDPDRSAVCVGDEPYNVDFYNMGGLATLWDNIGFLEYWRDKAAQDPWKPDSILDHFAQARQQQPTGPSPSLGSAAIPGISLQPPTVDFIENRLPHYHQAFADTPVRFDPALGRFVPVLADAASPSEPAPLAPGDGHKGGHYDTIDGLGQFPRARPLPPGTSAMGFWASIFEETVVRFRSRYEEPKGQSQSRYNIRTAMDWEGVYSRLQAAREAYDGTKKDLRGRHKTAAHRDAAAARQSVRLIPDNDFTSPVRAAVEVVIEVSGWAICTTKFLRSVECRTDGGQRLQMRCPELGKPRHKASIARNSTESLAT